MNKNDNKNNACENGTPTRRLTCDRFVIPPVLICLDLSHKCASVEGLLVQERSKRDERPRRECEFASLLNSVFFTTRANKPDLT